MKVTRLAKARKLSGIIAAVICLLFCGSGNIRYQQNTADVVGTVADSSGAVVPAANVTITNTSTNITQTAVSSAAGEYIFSLLQVGTYTLKVEATGFKTFIAPSVTLSAGDRARVDAVMEVGNVSQTVEVSATVAPALQTDTSTIGSTVTAQAVEDVPLDGRNVTKLIQLAPGVNQGAPNDLDSGSRPDDRRPTVAFSANGQSDGANNVLVDGMDNNSVRGSTVLRPSVDAIQEVNIATNMYDASLTRTGGAAVNIITKSGSNSIHGSGYEFFRNAVLNTNPNYRFPSGYCPTSGVSGGVACTPGALFVTQALAKPPFRQNQYGGSVGGPIKKDKTFFFGDLEKFDRGLGIPITATVPTLCQKGLAACPVGPQQFGNFSELSTISAFGGSSASGPANSGPVIPTASITPLGRAYFNMYPLPTNSGLTNNYNSTALALQNSTTFDVRIDQHFSDSNTLFVRYSFNDTTTVTPDAFPQVTIDPATGNLSTTGVTFHPGASSANGTNSFPGVSKERSQGLALSYVHVFSPNVLLNLKAGYDRLADNALSLNNGTNLANKLGFPCTAVSCINFGSPTSSGMPNITTGTPAAYTNIGDATFLPIIIYVNTWEYAGTLTWNKGPHSIRMGAQLIRRWQTSGQNVNGEGGFAFTGGFTGVQGGDLLEGLAANGYTRGYTLVQQSNRFWEPGVFVQDDWRAKRWLTLNLGVRYDIFTPGTEKYGRITNFNPALGLFSSPAMPGAQQSDPTALVQTFYGSIAPRVGFAATLRHNTVVRGGFGMSYFGSPTTPGRNPPFTFNATCQAQNGNNSNSACAAPFAASQTVEYGPAVSGTSQVGHTGGALFAAGVPIPVLSITPILLPASCGVGANPASAGCTTIGGNAYASFGTVGSVWPRQPGAYLEQVNLQVQKDFASNVVMVGYVGEFGRHLAFSNPLNTINADPSRNAAFSVGSPLASQGGFPWLAHGAINSTIAWGTSSYNALQAAFVRRFKSGLTVNVNYTWSHAMANGQGPCHPEFGIANLGIGNGPKYVDPCYYDNIASPASPFVVTAPVSGPGMIGNTQFDVPNRVAGTVNYQLPFGKSMTGLGAVLVKGWSTNVAGSWQSGLPFNIANGAPLAGVGGSLDQVCSGKAANPSLAQWVNPACFLQPTSHTYGVMDTLQLFGPRQRSVDFSFSKDFNITERFRLQFRTEIFNLFNTPNFTSPGGATGSIGSAPPSTTIAAFTNSTASGSPGLAQNPNATQSLHVGNINSLNPNFNSREIQFGLKLFF